MGEAMNTAEIKDASISFSLPRDPQLDSQLVKLPAEIKFIILRLFLKFPPFESHKSRGYDVVMDESVAEIRSRIRDGLNVASTCQTLYDEANAVLFRGNPVCIEFFYIELGGNWDFRLLIPLFDYFPEYRDVDFSFKEVPESPIPRPKYRHKIRTQEDLDCMLAWQEQRAKALYEALRRFRTFKLHISPSLANQGLINPVKERTLALVEEAMFNTVLAFRCIFARRSLIIIAPVPEDYPLFEKHPHLLVSCRMLDCVSIDLEGFQIPERVKRDLAGTISSDLFNDCFRLEDRIQGCIPDRGITWDSNGAIKKLQHVATHCDEAATYSGKERVPASNASENE